MIQSTTATLASARSSTTTVSRLAWANILAAAAFTGGLVWLISLVLIGFPREPHTALANTGATAVGMAVLSAVWYGGTELLVRPSTLKRVYTRTRRLMRRHWVGYAIGTAMQAVLAAVLLSGMG